MKNSLVLRFFQGVFFSIVLFPSYALSDGHHTLNNLLKGKVNVGVIAVDLDSKRTLFKHNEQKPLKPASVMKLLTSAVALRELGPEYTFTTEVWAKGHQGARVAVLGIKGYGDPTLTLEQAWLLARGIRKLGIRSVDRLILDDSAFIATNERSGQSAYQAQATALALSFNAVAFNVCPQGGGKAHVLADPWEAAPKVVGAIRSVNSGATNFSIDESYRGKSLYYTVGGVINGAEGCRTIYRSVSNPLFYFGSVFSNYLQSLGVTVIEQRSGHIVEGSKLLFKHESKPLRQVVSDLNHYSNNFIAEQILFNIGGRAGQGRLDRVQGLRRVEQYLASLGYGNGGIRLIDASGLSHDNRVTAAALAAVLVDMVNNSALATEYKASLPVAGRSGTLKKKRFTTNATVRAKTGSLDGVTTLAGYIDTLNGKRIGFVILQNNSANSAELERKLLDALAQLEG